MNTCTCKQLPPPSWNITHGLLFRAHPCTIAPLPQSLGLYQHCSLLHPHEAHLIPLGMPVCQPEIFPISAQLTRWSLAQLSWADSPLSAPTSGRKQPRKHGAKPP